MEQEPRNSGWFRPLYIGWCAFALLCLCIGLAKYGHVPVSLALYAPPLAGALLLLYFPLKWLFEECRDRDVTRWLRVPLAVLLCAVALLPLIWAVHKNYYPDCGKAEMERMVAEGTAYFESHREELEQQAAAGAYASSWSAASGRTFGRLEYYSGSFPDWSERGYPMHYPLDAHWVLCFFEDYS